MPAAAAPIAPEAPQPIQPAPASRDESFEMDAPFAGSRMPTPEPATRRALDMDENLDRTLDRTLDRPLDRTLDGTLDRTIDDRTDTPTGPRSAIVFPPERLVAAAAEEPEIGTRPVPVVAHLALESLPEVAAPRAPARPPVPEPPRFEPAPPPSEPAPTP